MPGLPPLTKEQRERLAARNAPPPTKELEAVPFDSPAQTNGANGHADFRISLVRHALDTETTEDSFRRIIAEIVEGRWVNQVQAVRTAFATGGKAAADAPKKALPAILFSGTFARRAADALKQHSGLICVDLDHLGDRLPSIRESIEADPHTLCAFVSPTGTGLKVVFRCSPTTEHLRSYKAAERYCLEHFGLEIDPACKDVSRLCFVSFDPETFIAEHCEPLPELPEPAEFKAPAESKPGAALTAGLEPWDDYDQRADLPALLTSRGWTPTGKYGWTRPGKTSGVSATWGKVPGRFYVFTSSTEFEANHTYRPWHVYAILNHGGDWSRAVAALRKDGYGSQPARSPKPAPAAKPEVYDPGYEEPESRGAAVQSAPEPAAYVSKWPKPIRADELCANPPPKPAVLIEGILYSGGTMLFAGPSKSMKTFSALDVGIAISSGEPWLGYKTTAVPVLYLNLELQDFATEERIAKISSARAKKPPHDLIVWNLRGQTVTLAALTAELPAMIKEFGAKVVCIDPHYKVSAVSDMEENSNDAQGKLLTLMEGLCCKSGAALILTHHFAKGDASGKNAIDRASGGGVFARWGDVMLTFTPHEEDEAMTVEMSLRNFAPVRPFVVRWEYPRWTRDGALDPAKLKTSRGPKEKHKPESVLHALGDVLMGYSEWEKATGMSSTTFKRKRQELLDSGLVEQIGLLYRKKKTQGP